MRQSHNVCAPWQLLLSQPHRTEEAGGAASSFSLAQCFAVDGMQSVAKGIVCSVIKKRDLGEALKGAGIEAVAMTIGATLARQND